MSGKSVILLTQYIGTSSTDFTADSVARLTVKRIVNKSHVQRGGTSSRGISYHRDCMTVLARWNGTLGVPFYRWFGTRGYTRFEGVPNHRDSGLFMHCQLCGHNQRGAQIMLRPALPLPGPKVIARPLIPSSDGPSTMQANTHLISCSCRVAR